MVGYVEKSKSDTYKLYNPETNRVNITRDVKWADWKMKNPAETLKIFSEADK